ncbi:hypothetical protein F5J12DRAFT_246294 [Pisolithus orientalis]|uniref:uncharacterized protein n=1 Tax=Pisolithus orientalis TaxID=936130 RepID=UPI002224D420|nr:uncharacterized protein F5J12DRAFT_246294 [Pisolithus orientalis]KAI6001003.1 hypothetical protein F5J12DRAFT_246294 [Pisolithus orientalis]
MSLLMLEIYSPLCFVLFGVMFTSLHNHPGAYTLCTFPPGSLSRPCAWLAPCKHVPAVCTTALSFSLNTVLCRPLLWQPFYPAQSEFALESFEDIPCKEGNGHQHKHLNFKCCF